MAYAGFDSYGFPGADQMAWLKANTNLVWCGYYLAPAPSHGDESWMGQRAALAGAGWGLAPTYLGQQLGGPGSHVVTAAQGAIDGVDAAAKMTAEGFAPGSFVYLDLEDGPPFEPPRTGYVQAWAAAVTSAGFGAGIYCSHVFAGRVAAALPGARIWAYKVATTAAHDYPGTNFPDLGPAGSGYAGAYMWQSEQNAVIGVQPPAGATLQVDLSSALGPDPSA
jgi:hypothetical protein